MNFDIFLHKNILIKILKDIYTNPSIGSLLGFKDGTAAYFFYNLPRFSVDLDFDLIQMDQEDFVLKEMENILKAYGIIKDVRQKRYTLFFLLSYLKGINIKIEINKRDFGSHYEIRPYLGISMKVMTKEGMSAHKLVALYEREGSTNRDIFDIHFFLKNNWPVSSDIIKKCTGLPNKKFLLESLKILEKVSERNILSGIGELLDQKQKEWAKKNLKAETIFLIKLAIENL